MSNGTIVNMYLWGLGTDLIAEMDPAGTIQRTFIYTPSLARLGFENNYSTTPKLTWIINDTTGTPIKQVNANGDIIAEYATSPFGHLQYDTGQMDRGHLVTIQAPFVTGYTFTKGDVQTIKNIGAIVIATNNIMAETTVNVVSQTGITFKPGFVAKAGTVFHAYIAPAPAPEQKLPYILTGHEYEDDFGLYYMQARWYDPVSGQFLSVDPEKPDYNSPLTLNPYLYCLNDPLRYNDPDGRMVESLWDAANLAMGAASLYKNIQSGNYLGAALDGVGVVADGVSLALPFVPGGAGATFKAIRTADAVADGAKATKEATQVAKAGKEATETSKKAIVIGEGMRDIKTVAKQLQVEGVNAKWYSAWGKNFPKDRIMTDVELAAAKARNARWIKSKMKAGYDIYDIGIDPLRIERSPFYQLEKDILQNYPVIPMSR